jgi:hypothetical protein
LIRTSEQHHFSFYKNKKMLKIFLLLPLFAQAQQDSVFLYKNAVGKSYHSIFIGKNTDTSAFDLKNSDSDIKEFYQTETKQLLEKHHVTARKIDFGDLARDWEALYVYKNEYYLYSPNDGANYEYLRFDDTIMIQNPVNHAVILLDSVFQVNQNTFDIKYYTENKAEKSVLRIHIVDTEKQIAVFEFLNEKREEYRYRLMIATQKTYLFPKIINNSTEKQFEFQFDAVDFDVLLK